MKTHPQGLLLCVLFFITFGLLHLVEAGQEGFISLDCGLSASEPPYFDSTTGLTYTTDNGFVQSGKTSRIDKEMESTYNKPILQLRYFPEGVRNCYTLNVTLGTKYLIRASFVYGNYDGLNKELEFDLYLGPNLWANVNTSMYLTNGVTTEEIIHSTKSKVLQVCLIKTGTSIPIINSLDLRPLINDTYNTQSGSLKYLFRNYFSTSRRIIRYPNDVNDRHWYPFFDEDVWTELTTNLIVNSSNVYHPPQSVMASAATPISKNAPFNFSWSLIPSTAKLYMYMHFAEIQTLQANDTRQLDVLLNGINFYTGFRPKTLATSTIFSTIPDTCEGGKCTVELLKTSKSTLPPLCSALEVFTVIDFLGLETNQDDVFAIKNIQNTYGVSKINWQGDPCVPKQFIWDGLNCNNSDISTPPIITSLDLSNNNLTGGVPEFLASIKSLLVINLSGNNLTGSVPQILLQKKGLTLNLEGNIYLNCPDGSCVHEDGNGGAKKKNVVVLVVVSIALVVVLGTALALFLVFRKRKTPHSEGPPSSSTQTQVSDARTTRSSDPIIVNKNRRFTYSEVVKMTNNFEKILGKGGFGMVYHGTVNDTEQVAVKMLSPSSSQGYKEFKAEVELLLRVHHKNLVGLVGYCDEGENLSLIYEYMANGDLKEHMLGNQGGSILDWKTRLKIVAESAQGLEYLHNGCKPPMVHRDVKTTNILLDEHFQAKLADFGLSRSFPIEGETRVDTVVAGTPGYLDPEYYRTNWLNEKSDVYSFGIVLLEIITNQPVINQSREKPHIAEWVGVMLTKGDIKSIIDPKFSGDYDAGSVWRAVELAMSCVNPSSIGRPTMSQVVIELNECLASENSRKGISQNMESKGSIRSTEVSMNFGTEYTPEAR
ncbi:Protein kinase domain [Arabidopsis suecica]|uniref:non-specific serine/threonine protein kinase n=1 Tax=Arabidopsis suecica TaxID=45249 RepID=A0A8T2B7V8_ARASU|nr:Protein kinase domain [Arabidopsis suecica]